LSLTNLPTQRQRIAELARMGTQGNLRDFLCQRVTDDVINTTMSEALHEEPEAGNLHIQDCEG
jgi:hypothetical protein